MDRRGFLVTASGAALAPRVALASNPAELIAQPVDAQILPEGDPATPMLGFNGQSPGPMLRVRKGEYFDIRFVNRIDEGSSVHWHGIRIDNAMDGVPGMTQPLIGPGDEFAYRFRAPDAGTFWYHSHHRSWEQVARGLYGPLIVEEPTPPDTDHDLVVMLDDWRLTDAGALEGDFEKRHDRMHEGRIGNYARILLDPRTDVRRGDRVRLRLANVATDRVFPVRIEGIEGKVVALDGMPLPEPRDLSDIVLAPAQRADVIADVTATDQVAFASPLPSGPIPLGGIPVAGENAARRPSPVPALPPNDMAPPDMANAIDLTMTMEGGAMSPKMGSLPDIWAINGQSGMTDTPFHSFERGQTARIRMVNDSLFAHGMHLHGHHFFEVGDDGGLGAFRDTTLIEANAARDVVCVFDNPGKWLIHCHMLGHQAAGMKTWIEVA